jgi:hypothetical protein
MTETTYQTPLLEGKEATSSLPLLYIAGPIARGSLVTNVNAYWSRGTSPRVSLSRASLRLHEALAEHHLEARVDEQDLEAGEKFGRQRHFHDHPRQPHHSRLTRSICVRHARGRVGQRARGIKM